MPASRIFAAFLGAMCAAVLVGQAQAGRPPSNEIEKPKTKRVVVTYGVTDLVVPIENHPSPIIELQKKRTPSKTEANTATGQPLDEQLIRLIAHTIAPETWSGVGGKGTIQYYPLGMALVVGPTAWVLLRRAAPVETG